MPRGQRKSETYNARVRVTVGTARPVSSRVALSGMNRGWVEKGSEREGRGRVFGKRRTWDTQVLQNNGQVCFREWSSAMKEIWGFKNVGSSGWRIRIKRQPR